MFQPIVINYLSACQTQAIGVASSYTIPDSSFSASSTSGSDTPSNGRLNGQGAWSPSNDNNANDYLEIDLQYEFLICAVATQGKSTANHWTAKYKLLTSLNNKDWDTYQENKTDKVCLTEVRVRYKLPLFSIIDRSSGQKITPPLKNQVSCTVKYLYVIMYVVQVRLTIG